MRGVKKPLSLQRLLTARLQVPELRLGQLIVCAMTTNKYSELFYMKDEDLFQQIEDFVKYLKEEGYS
jgi:hypothetical protein